MSRRRQLHRAYCAEGLGWRMPNTVPAFHSEQLGPEEVLVRMALDIGTRHSTEMVRPALFAHGASDRLLCSVNLGGADDADG